MLTLELSLKIKSKFSISVFASNLITIWLNIFKKLTGREFQPVKENKVNLVNSKAVKIDERGGYIWKEDLKQRILDAFYNTDNFDDFETVLEANNGVKIKHRRALSR